MCKAGTQGWPQPTYSPVRALGTAIAPRAILHPNSSAGQPSQQLQDPQLSLPLLSQTHRPLPGETEML